MKEKPVVLGLEPKYGMLFDGKHYYMPITKNGKPMIVLVPDDKIKKKLKKAKEIAEKLQGSLDAKAVLEESIMIGLGDKETDKLYNMLFKSKRKYKAKTRSHHCVDMKIGNFILPVVNG